MCSLFTSYIFIWTNKDDDDDDDDDDDYYRWIIIAMKSDNCISFLSTNLNHNCHNDTSPGVHFMSPGLLQLAAVRSNRQTHAASTVGADCCSKADHRSETSRTHHTDIASTSSVAGQTTSWIRDRQLGIPSAVMSSKVPGYLADDIHLASESSARSLRSSSCRRCSVTRVYSRFGNRCFTAAGPRIWNNLPASLRDKEVSCTEFRRQLKTFMFQADCGTSWLFWLLRPVINTLTYLGLLTYSYLYSEWLLLPILHHHHHHYYYSLVF